MERKFFTSEPVTKEPIYLVEGEIGHNPLDLIEGIHNFDASLNALNAFFGNTPRDLEIALACSMFGWDIPFANELSERGDLSE